MGEVYICGCGGSEYIDEARLLPGEEGDLCFLSFASFFEQIERSLPLLLNHDRLHHRYHYISIHDFPPWLSTCRR
jgi:hypothetical protein